MQIDSYLLQNAYELNRIATISNLFSLIQVDGLLRVNGDIGSVDAPATPKSQGRESPPHFEASPSVTINSTVDAPSSAASPTHSPHASTKGESPVSTKANEEAQGVTGQTSKDNQEEKVTEHSTPPSRPTSLPSVRIRIFRSLIAKTS